MALAIITEAQFVEYIFPFGLNTRTNSAIAFGQWIITCGRSNPVPLDCGLEEKARLVPWPSPYPESGGVGPLRR
jgi:hypothetical protein